MEIDLREIQTICYTCNVVGVRQPVYQRRRQRANLLLQSLGFAQFGFYYGIQTDPYWVGLCAGHARLIGELKPPLLIVEDDIQLRDPGMVLSIPDGADCVYLGGSHYGDPHCAEGALRLGLRPRRWHQWAYTPIDADWVRVFGVSNTHAILWLGRECMQQVSSELRQWRSSVDSFLASNHWRWQCVLKRVPTFWQHDNHHLRDTWRYLD